MRRIEKLMDNWLFTHGNGLEEKVVTDLPHTWNGKDGQDGGNDYWRGTCTYEKQVKKPDFAENERVYLQFHGVSASAKVFLNGQLAGSHDGGYSTFRMDVTDLLEEDNDLLVEVDNRVNDYVYPQKADFTFYGGIYRDVEFLIVRDAHFDLDYYGGFGMKYDAEVNGSDADIKVNTFLNGKAKTDRAEVRVILKDAEGTVVAEGEGNEAVLHVEDVHLWDGINDPYLYTLTGQLVVAGEIVDQVQCQCGVRYFHFDSHKGLFLNGKPVWVRGVSRHQDWKDIGNAIKKENMDQDMEIIREVGANSIRLAHYQHEQYFYDLCDKYGMIVWAEIPYISEHLPNGRENTFSQMKELIVQNHHHPSILMWGVSNEITISGNNRKNRADMLDNHHALQKICKEMDPVRATTLACYAVCHPFHPVSKITDIVGWNLYLGWYTPFLILNDFWISFYHKVYPNRCLGYSEYGAEGMPNLHNAKPKRGDNSEEYQCVYHEYMLDCFQRHTYMWGTYVWNMFDFAADARDQGGEPGMNHKGLVTFDRKLKKDSFYLYKAHWTAEPMLHLAGKRYEYRHEPETEIKVYTNLTDVELYNNGKLIERQHGKKVFRFKLPLAKENHIEVRAGGLTDSAVIYKVDKAKPEYRLAKGDSSNWM